MPVLADMRLSGRPRRRTVRSERLAAVLASVCAVTIALGSALAQPSGPSAAQLLARPSVLLSGYAPDGAAAVRQLEYFVPFTIQGRRGTCYAIHAALESDAELDSSLMYGFALNRDFNGEMNSLPLSSMEQRPNFRNLMRDLVVVVGCPVSDMPIRIAFNDEGMRGSFGRGTVVFQLYARPISPQRLDKVAGLYKLVYQRAEIEQAAAEQQLEAQCKECLQESLRCQASPQLSSAPGRCDINRCLLRHGLSGRCPSLYR